ncbi:hypothetical protein BD310DRAFT_917356 [Dichomitus squalens]|uniref:Uncharacterized protein n=1 Tax=Dichomitus squalens TaxID=114155 RepID=A0A4Q9Q6D8_9APHY|nr:hypothetical protein BD310DRAFT_917356 [Dichomitus squalens]
MDTGNGRETHVPKGLRRLLLPLPTAWLVSAFVEARRLVMLIEWSADAQDADPYPDIDDSAIQRSSDRARFRIVDGGSKCVRRLSGLGCVQALQICPGVLILQDTILGDAVPSYAHG